MTPGAATPELPGPADGRSRRAGGGASTDRSDEADTRTRSAATRLGGVVKLGVRYIDARSVETAAQLFGLSGASVGDPKAYAAALIKDINARGGLLGRRIEPTYRPVDAVELALNSAAAEEEACRALTEDAKVFAVVSPGPTNQAFTDCMSKRKVPVVNASYNYFTPSLMRTYGDHFYFPVGMDASRSARAFVSALKSRGYFASGYKLGLVRLDTPVHENVLNEAIKPALRANGLALHEDFAMRNAQDSAGFSSAVLRFRTRGVTNVIFIESAGQMALGFTDQAENQGYRPRYGFSSHASLLGIEENTPPAQLARSIGIGWIRASDATGPKGAELGTAGTACRDLLRRSAAEIADNGALTFALWTCDTFRFLDAIVEKGGAPSTAGMARGVRGIGRSFTPASTFSAAFPDGRHDGVTSVRPLAYQTACRCFRWAGAASAVP